MLVNLLDNAVKYSPTAARSTVRVENATDAVRISVADQGLGIPLAEQQRVFEKFYRPDTAPLASRGGTGLGPLHLARARAANGRHVSM